MKYKDMILRQYIYNILALVYLGALKHVGRNNFKKALNK